MLRSAILIISKFRKFAACVLEENGAKMTSNDTGGTQCIQKSESGCQLYLNYMHTEDFMSNPQETNRKYYALFR